LQTKGSPDKEEDPVKRAICALVAVCAAALASTAYAAHPDVGDYVVAPGETITFSNMTLNSCNSDIVGVYILQTGATTQSVVFGNNSGSLCEVVTLDSQSFTNNTTADQRFRVWLQDTTCDVRYDPLGSHAKVTARSAALNDGGGSDCTKETSPNIPKGKNVNFIAQVTIG
jgi:hypothetical protein